MEKILFTSESVTEGHPDKVCDSVSDAILDAMMEQDPMSRVACETATTTGLVLVMGEITTKANVDIQKIVRDTIREIGYDNADYGFDADTCAVITALDKQSADIAMGVDKALEQKEDSMNEDELDSIGAGDQGLQFGYASNETEEYMPYAINMAHKLAQQLTKVRKDGTLKYLRPDGKTQVTVEYDEAGKPKRIDAVVCSTQHDPDVTQEQIHEQLPPVGVGRSGSNSGNAGQKEYDGKTLTPGMIKELNAGDEVQVVNPTGQATDAASFTKLHQRMIGAGQGLSYEATSRDMSETNYASARQGAIEDELTYAEDEEKIMTALDEIYETFVISCVLAGLVQIKDFWLKKDKYLKHEWIKQPKKWIDPLKESSATKTAMQTGQKTFKQIAAESGRDWRRQVDDMAEVLEYGRKKGIDLEGVIFNAKSKEKDPEKEDAAGQEPSSEEGGGGDTTAGGSEAAKE